MDYISVGNTYYYIKQSDLQILIEYGYLDAAAEFCYHHPSDDTYLYAKISSVDLDDEFKALFAYWYGPDEEYDPVFTMPLFNYNVSNQIPEFG